MRSEQGKARVIPIMLRYTNLHDTPFGNLAPLPRNGKPVTSWKNRDEAFFDIARGIQQVVKETSAANVQWVDEGITF